MKQGITIAQFREALMELVLSLNELDPARELRDPDVELAGKGINFFAIKTPRKK